MRVRRVIGIVVLAVICFLLGGLGGYALGQTQKSQAVDAARQQAEKDQAANTDDTSDDATDEPNPGKTTDALSCNADELSVTAAVEGGAAGTIGYALTFTNTGNRTCTMFGFPGVSLVNDNGNRIGSPADRNTGFDEKKATLKPNGRAKALMTMPQKGNFSPGKCSTGATKIRIYPPDDTGYISTVSPIDYWCPGFQIAAIGSL